VIIRSDYFRALGGFDESLAACEDYDLWLRVSVRDEIGLLDEPLVIRRGGHPDQLSATTPALDRFRIISLMKILGEPELTPEKRAAACDALIEKCAIYAGGLERRGRPEAAHLCCAITQAATAWREAPDAALVESIAKMRAAVQDLHLPPVSDVMEPAR